jgi:hypothetical protein
MTVRRAILTLDLVAAHAAGEDRHPGVVSRWLGHRLGFRVMEMTRHEDDIQATFEIEAEGALPWEDLPSWCEMKAHR